MLAVPPARLRSRAAPAIHGPTTSTHNLFWHEPLRRRGGRVTSILQRRPREVYRVYTEEEYLNGAGFEPATVDESPIVAEPGRTLAGERRLRRAAGVAMLAGAIATVGAVLAANISRTHRGAARRSGSLVAATRSSSPVPSPVQTGSGAAPAVAHRTVQATRLSGARAGLRSGRPGRSGFHPSHLRAGGSDSHPSTLRRSVGGRAGNLPLTGARPPRGGGARITVDYSPGSSPGAGEVVPIHPGTSPDSSTATGSSAGSFKARAEAGGHAEFGFER
ncbi:MAG: hypothetical protein ACHQCH_08735 [Solirubrobacterales bacterium]